MRNYLLMSVVSCIVCLSCNNASKSPESEKIDDLAIKVPHGFSALIIADSLGRGRHIAISNNGDIYLALEELRDGHGIVALRDTSGDGRADITRYFGNLPGTGIQIHNGYLYFAHDTGVIRYKLANNKLLPDSGPETIVYGFKREYQHSSKTIAFDGVGNLYVNVGAPSNACQQNDRTPGSPGMDPCPILENYGGIWRFKDNKLKQTQQKDGYRYATGLRNCVAIEWNSTADRLFVVQHGRDQLNQFYPEYYSDEDNANQPAEEFFMLEDGDDCGWPYCYYDDHKKLKLLNPEFGGTGENIGQCADKKQPIMAFPAHTAPNDLIFYTGHQFPARFQNGAFIAFHGSWNRTPMLQKGFYVVFVPFQRNAPSGKWEVFADGFAGRKRVKGPDEAVHRPMGLVMGSDGSLYISDSVKGTIWKVVYK